MLMALRIEVEMRMMVEHHDHLWNVMSCGFEVSNGS